MVSTDGARRERSRAERRGSMREKGNGVGVCNCLPLHGDKVTTHVGQQRSARTPPPCGERGHRRNGGRAGLDNWVLG
jgi:hypothetical protein